MRRSFISFLVISTICFGLNRIFSRSSAWTIDLFFALVFGFGWALAYSLDRPNLTLIKKICFSFIGAAVVGCVGFFVFNLEISILSIIRYSTIFVAYYLIASFRTSKTLRK